MIPTLFTILLLEGFVTISVEIIAIRQLLPFFGGSVIITSIIIGIFLLFLAAGYWRGGNHRQDFLRQLSLNFMRSLIGIGIGFSYSFLAVFYYYTVNRAHFAYLFSLFGYLLLVLAPVVYWLGQTIPLTTNLFNQQQRVSHISGRALFISTLGSVLGALLTSLILFQYFGVAWTILINCLLLLGLIIYLQPHSGISWLHILLLVIAFAFIGVLNLNMEKQQFSRTNNYANYQVIDSLADGKLLQINRSNSSLLTPDKKGFPYIELIRDLLFNQLQLHHKKILVVGAGGFTLTAAGQQDNTVTYVDVDPAIKDIAETYFLQEKIHGKFVGQDARSYLKQTNDQFEVILSDVYSHQASIPASLLTVEYFQALANHLTANGLLIVNIIANPLFADNYSQIVYNTILSVFPYCAVIPLSWQPQHLSNVIYVCPKITVHPKLYRDDKSSATFDFFSSQDRV